MKKYILILPFILICEAVFAQKPAVWIISDGGYKMNDPDDISAIAGYLLMSNQFDTRAVVLGSSVLSKNKNKINQQKWAEDTFGKAYSADLFNLNKYIGGYKENIRFLESSIKGCGENFDWQKNYDLKNFPSISALYKEVLSNKELLNILCFGPLTEQAIFVNYCIRIKKEKLLSKVRFISHWTNSNYHVGSLENPEHTHNCFGDPIACDYMKQMAKNGTIKFYECGGIGQYGIVEGAPKGERYYNQFKISNLGKIFAEGKFVRERVDDSDCATYLVLLGNNGVSLNDISNNGLNSPDTELRNEKSFFLHSKETRDELLRRSNAAAGINPNVVYKDVIVPEHGMADAHTFVKGDTLFVICGHDESWDGKGSFRMDRWEIWSTVDLKTWKYHHSIYPSQTYIGDNPNCWAGDICERNGKYYWFFSNRNIDTGVMCADKIDGVYKDILGKPLLPKGIVPVHPYDPAIYHENGVYTICFGAGTYYMATLANDMKSLSTMPKAVSVVDDKGNKLATSDKSTIIKRNGWYYLIYGHRYAMSKNLYGPYLFKGNFLNGGHTSLFQWHGQWYVLQENHDISAFFRGISLKPVFFNEDGTIIIPPSDRMYPGPGRSWNFTRSTMGWKALKGTTVCRDENNSLSGDINDSKALIVSAPWLCTISKDCKEIRVTIKNRSYANKMRIALFTRDSGKDFWTSFTNPVDWDNQEWVTQIIEPNSDRFITYKIPFSKFTKINQQIMQVALQPLFDTYNGHWEIKNITIQ